MGYPVSINTDDRGVFNTTLTEEIVHVKNVLQLDMSEVVELIGEH
jgi:adenosine deaminase